MNLAPYSKAIVALLTGICFLANNLGVPEGTTQLVFNLLLTVLGTFGVYQVPNKPGNVSSSTSNSPWLISILAVLLTLFLMGCGATLGDLKPSSEASRSYDGKVDADLMVTVAKKAYRDCHEAAPDRPAQDACFNRKESTLDAIESALPLMEQRDRSRARAVLSDYAAELLRAGTDEQDEQLKGWLQ